MGGLWAAMLLLGATVGAAGSDWPMYRHDTALSGVSMGKGMIVRPAVKWSYYLGCPWTPLAADRQDTPWTADLDGNGEPETLSVAGKTIRVLDRAGQPLWEHALAGEAHLERVRIAGMLPDRKGTQVVVFTSRMDSGEGQGYCFTFHKGAAQGELAWTTGPLTGQYAPTLVIDDVDGDSVPEVVTAPHYRVQIFNGQTGALKAEIPWKVGRNYGALLTRPRRDGPGKDLFILCDFVPHVDCLRYQEGRWTHAWGHRYVEENAPEPRGRRQYLRVGPNPVADLDGDDRDEMVYMHFDAARDDQWHLRVRDSKTGTIRADLPGVWLWSVADLDGDGAAELVYTPTRRKRPSTYCDLHVARLSSGKLADLAVIRRARPILMNATLPPTAHTIADEGCLDLLRADLNADGRPELFYALRSRRGRAEDCLRAVSLAPGGRLARAWAFDRPAHRLNLVYAGPAGGGESVVRLRDLTAAREVTVDARGNVVAETDLGRPGGFVTTPIVVDLEGDGRNEIVVQNAAQEIVALRPGGSPDAPPTILWSRPGVGMNPQPGYTWNGALGPQAADLDGDGRLEVVFASEDAQGLAAVACVDGRGRLRWRRSIPGCPWGGLQAGVNLWTFGRFTGRGRGRDVYVDVHRRSKGSSEGWILRGDTGAVVWRREGIVAEEHALAFGGRLPAVADVNGDGIDDLITAPATIYGVFSGRDAQPLFPPRLLGSPTAFGRWIAYASPTVADLDGDGRLEVYLNSDSYARGGIAAVRIDGKPLWARFHTNDEGADGFGPVGDFDGDGRLEIGVPALDGTLRCLNAADGSPKWTIRTPVTGDVVAADVNSDGTQELLFAGRDGRLRAISGRDGSEVWSIAVTGRPVIADVNGDGWVEIIAVGPDGVLRVIG